MSAAVTTSTPHLPAPADLMAVRGYVAESLAPATRRAYRAGLAAFRAWCEAQGVADLPASAETVAVAIRDLMASQGHRNNILSPNYSNLGVGFAEDATGMKYFTMVFLGPP